jgi:predicted exporter
MIRWLSLVWVVIVALAGSYLLAHINAGFPLRTDLLALLPREERDPVLQLANETVTRNLSRRIVVLIGHRSRDSARAAADELTRDLLATGVLEPSGDAFSGKRLKRIGQLYFPYRQGLMTPADRTSLTANRGEEIAERAMAQVFGVGGIANAQQLRTDPFLLLQAFMTDLPIPLSRLALDDGMLTVTDRGIVWVAVLANLTGEPFALETQDRLVGIFERAAARLRSRYQGLELKRLGAVFFAQQGAKRALTEASWLSSASILGSMALIIAVFRRFWPLLGNMLVVVVGIGVGLAASLWLFGDVHVAALLFGTSLIGMAVDYGLFYTTSIFDPAAKTPAERLQLTFPGMTLGLLTTLLGYGALMLAPFPGLRQIAVFSVIGLVAAFLTVLLWLPQLDRSRQHPPGGRLLTAAERTAGFWQANRWQPARAALLVLAAIVAIVGLLLFRTDDDVRRLQALAPDLLRDQEEIRGLIGATAANQYLLIEAIDDETALRLGEALQPTLTRLVQNAAITSAQAPAAFVPSAERQAENRQLRLSALEEPHLARYLATLGLPQAEAEATVSDGPVLTLREAMGSDAVPFLRELVIGPGLHVVALQGLLSAEAVRAAVAGMPGVRFVDPTADFSRLLGQYRIRAIVLTVVSALVMLLGLAWRYGLAGSAWVMLPAGVAVLLVPAFLAMLGQPYTFFHAMAQVILLAIGTDYSIFCAEGASSTRLLAVWLAAMTSLLSFGLLVFSCVPAVHGFGSAMLIGIIVSVALAPLANRARRRQRVA